MKHTWFINRNFAFLWFGQSLSQLGDAVIEVTLPIWVGMLTNDSAHVAGVAATEMLPSLCIGPLAGVLADCKNPRITMMACDILRTILVGSLLLVSTSILPWYIYVVSFCTAVVGSLFNPAKNVTIHLLVEKEEIVQAQALLRVTQSGALIIGPALGSSILLLYGPKMGLLFDVCSFGIGASSLLLMQRVVHRLTLTSNQSLHDAWHALWLDVWDGVKFTVQDQFLMLLIIVSSVVSLVGSLWYTVDIFFVEQSLNMSKESVGLLWTASGIGGLVGSLLVVMSGKKVRQVALLLVGLFVRGGSLIWYATSTGYTWAIPAAFFAGVGDALVLVTLGSLVMEHAKLNILGRVTALFDTMGQLSSLLVLATVGILSTRFTPTQMLLICGLLICIVGIGAGLRLIFVRIHP
ncbi:MAG TPA: MFS transporter [Ktedonobacteraceae bacterium]|nr:MFS transporter [Ktedonobacteraceae bacterium]